MLSLKSLPTPLNKLFMNASALTVLCTGINYLLQRFHVFELLHVLVYYAGLYVIVRPVLLAVSDSAFVMLRQAHERLRELRKSNVIGHRQLCGYSVPVSTIVYACALGVLACLGFLMVRDVISFVNWSCSDVCHSHSENRTSSFMR